MIRRGIQIVGADGTLTTAGYMMLAGLDRLTERMAAAEGRLGVAEGRLDGAEGRLDSAEGRLNVLEGLLEAASLVPDAAGGATVDAEARAELVAIKAALW